MQKQNKQSKDEDMDGTSSSSYCSPAASGVPTQVFDQFLRKLKEGKTPVAVIERLRATLLEGRDFSPNTIKAAIFPEGDESQ